MELPLTRRRTSNFDTPIYQFFRFSFSPHVHISWNIFIPLPTFDRDSENFKLSADKQVSGGQIVRLRKSKTSIISSLIRGLYAFRRYQRMFSRICASDQTEPLNGNENSQTRITADNIFKIFSYFTLPRKEIHLCIRKMSLYPSINIDFISPPARSAKPHISRADGEGRYCSVTES